MRREAGVEETGELFSSLTTARPLSGDDGKRGLLNRHHAVFDWQASQPGHRCFDGVASIGGVFFERSTALAKTSRLGIQQKYVGG
jgi:hypothetical protein